MVVDVNIAITSYYYSDVTRFYFYDAPYGEISFYFYISKISCRISMALLVER